MPPRGVLEGRLLLDSTTVFNEIMYHPARQGEPEWIELHNQMAVDMDLSGWSLASGVSYEFPAGTVIPGGGYLVIAADPATLQTAFGVQVLGPWSGRLDNAGEQLELRDNNRRLMDHVEYDDRGEWPVAADGSGASLAKTNQANGASELATHWQASRRLGGSPGIENDPPREGFESPLVFNEVAAAGAGEFRVELLNVSDALVNLGGVVIASAGSVVSRYAAPPQSLEAGDYLSWSAEMLGFEPTAGDRLFLYAADGQAILDAVAVDESLRGRSPDGTGPGDTPTRRPGAVPTTLTSRMRLSSTRSCITNDPSRPALTRRLSWKRLNWSLWIVSGGLTKRSQHCRQTGRDRLTPLVATGPKDRA